MHPAQHTILREADYKGIGLHTGNMCKLTFKPAPENTGVIFIRTDLPGQPQMKAHYSNVVGVIRGTTIANGDARVHTIEHVLSAVYALGIDNLIIEVNANEPPVADGSSQWFYDTLKEAGLKAQQASKSILKPQEKLQYKQGETEITFEPADDLRITSIVMFQHPLIGRQEISLSIQPEIYRHEIAPARTFCFDYEVEALKKQGLARGGSLDNAVVIGLDRIHNKEKKLRFPDEFARHKALDLLGDLYLLGPMLKGHITAIRPGHGHNINFVKMMSERFVSNSAAQNPPERTSYATDRS